VPEHLQEDIQKMAAQGVYGSKNFDCCNIGALLDLLQESNPESSVVKGLVDIMASKPGLDMLLFKLKNKAKLGISELISALKQELNSKLDFPVKDPKHHGTFTKVCRIGAQKISYFFTNCDPPLKKYFLDKLDKQELKETVRRNFKIVGARYCES
jgi:hypothetical protein